MTKIRTNFKSIIAASLMGLMIANEPVKANPLAIPATGICATGVGCVLLGTVIIGGVAYYVYSHQGHKVYVRKSHQGVPKIHQENEEYDMGVVTAGSFNEAFDRCLRKYGHRVIRPESNGDGTYRCIGRE
jgi:hypothetical protein